MPGRDGAQQGWKLALARIFYVGPVEILSGLIKFLITSTVYGICPAGRQNS